MSDPAETVCTRCRKPWTPGISGAYRTCKSCRFKDASRKWRKRQARGDTSAAPPSMTPPLPASPLPSVPSVSVCSMCHKPWTSAIYRTCDSCRARTAGAQRRLRDSRAPLRAPPAADGAASKCTTCKKPWSSAIYHTCDDCRQEVASRRYQTSAVVQADQPSLRVATIGEPPLLNHADSVSNNTAAVSRRPVTLLAPEVRTATPLPACAAEERSEEHGWWSRLARLRIRPFRQSWTKSCPFCLASSLSTEKVGWCCSNGRKMAPRLPPYPSNFQEWLEGSDVPVSTFSRRLNSLFAFSAIATTREFLRHGSLANVVVTGRVYHRLLDLSSGEHSMRWFLYDEASRSETATARKVPLQAVEKVRQLLEAVNPYVRTVRRALVNVDPDSTPIAVQLGDFHADGEVAAIINTENLGRIDPRKVVFFHHNGRLQIVNILSRHYEPLQYPLLFPHGTPGWGLSGPANLASVGGWPTAVGDAEDDLRRLTQLQWCRSMILAEPRFLDLGRLCCEYLVDMFSRVEDIRLHYLKRMRTAQASGPDAVSGHPAPDWMQNRLPLSFMGS
ncbi:hypothetical protein S40288_11752 [Stachybotrys chartarum IBT 40288]|nr:hypothetical protein S40288_11752 [Stachybotrys chartarum IBT 40288]